LSFVLFEPSCDLLRNATMVVHIPLPVTLHRVSNISSILYTPMSRLITANGSPIKLKIIFKLKNVAIGTEGALIAPKRIMNDTIKSEGIAKSIPWVWAAKRITVPYIIRVPVWLRGMPKGIVNDEMSLETPISSRVSKCRGSVAFDDVDENAKIITGM